MFRLFCTTILLTLSLEASAQEARLVGGAHRCQGRLEFRPETSRFYGQACNLDTSINEAQVVCRQLGCDPQGARRVDPRTYGFSIAINRYAAFGFSCTGSESIIPDCSESRANCRTDIARYAIAIECGPGPGNPQRPEVRLVDGMNRCQGRLEIKLPGFITFGQACDLDAGSSEAQVVCEQLGCEPKGAKRADPRTYGFSPLIDAYAVFGFVCTGNEGSLANCTEQGAFCRSDIPDFAIAIECGGQFSPNVRLVDGIGRCQGRVEHRVSSSNAFSQSCDLDTGNNEAQVICRELGCDPRGAKRVNPTNYRFSSAVNSYRAFGFNCTGSETSLSNCQATGAVCAADSVDHALAVECGGSSPQMFLIFGRHRCEGLLVHRPLSYSSEVYGLSCDLNAGDEEAQAICRHIGCNPVGARRAPDPTVYMFSTAINTYRGFGYNCTGNEQFISACESQPFICETDSAPHAIAIECGA